MADVVRSSSITQNPDALFFAIRRKSSLGHALTHNAYKFKEQYTNHLSYDPRHC